MNSVTEHRSTKEFYFILVLYCAIRYAFYQEKIPSNGREEEDQGSDKACTSVRKTSGKKKSVSVENDDSYLQPQASHLVPISTLSTSEQT